MSDTPIDWASVERLARDCESARKTMKHCGTFPTGQEIMQDAANTLLALRAALDEAEARADRERWQPFDTAPKDGTWFLAIRAGEFAPGEPFLPQALRWHVDGWESVDEGQRIVSYNHTHWRPMIAGPSLKETDND